jgi:hypothetical protein
VGLRVGIRVGRFVGLRRIVGVRVGLRVGIRVGVKVLATTNFVGLEEGEKVGFVPRRVGGIVGCRVGLGQ